MKKILKNNWQILALEFTVLCIFIFFYGKFGDSMVDSFREVYIPQQILNGNAPYKDIFVIYPPLSYLINTFFIKIFGSSINVFYTLGLLSTMGIIYLSNKISKILLDKNFAFGIGLFLLAGLVLSPNVFNSIFPYSYGITYGLLFILTSILFVLNKNFPLGYLFYSLAILCKYEFLLLLPLLFFYTHKTSIWKNLLSLFSPMFLTFGILKIQGLNFEDIKTSFDIIALISKTKTLDYFYSVMGIKFNWAIIPIYLSNLFNFILPLLLITFFNKIIESIEGKDTQFKLNSKIVYLTLFGFIFFSLLFFNTHYQECLIFAFPLIVILFIKRYNTLNTNEKFYIIASLLISAKVFFALTLQSYGVYFLPFALISLSILIPEKFKKSFLSFLVILGLAITIQNGSILYKKASTPHKKVIEYVKNNTNNSDKVLVFPECLGINVLTERTSDNKFYSLIPLYVETFGEKIIIKRLEKTKPNFIIINNYDTSAYYYREFGTDYAQEILKWIKENYILQDTINDKWVFKIYKRIN